MADKPIQKYQAGGLQSAVWKKEIKDKEGKTFVVHNVSLQKSYKDKDDKWQNQTINLNNPVEIQRAELVLEEAKRFLLLSSTSTSSNEEGGEA